MNSSKSIDKFALIARIKELQSAYNSAFNQLKWNLNLVHSLNYESVFRMKDLPNDALADYIEDISPEITSLLNNHHLTKDKSYGLRAFTVKPTELSVSDEMSLREFTENNFLPNKCGVTFVHTLSYMEAADISTQLSLSIVAGVIDENEIEQEFLILEKFISEVKEYLKLFYSFSKEFDKLNEEDVCFDD